MYMHVYSLTASNRNGALSMLEMVVPKLLMNVFTTCTTGLFEEEDAP